MTETETLLQEIRERYAAAEQGWAKIREEGRTDIRYVAGRPWTTEDLAARKNRLTLVLDELGQYVNQAVNDVRLNNRSIKVAPQPSQIDSPLDRLADARANLIRQIEYRSNARQQAYTTMFESAVQRSFGWLRILPKYVSDRSFDQELIIAEIPNPDLVLPDPDHQAADGSDLEYLFYHEWHDEKEFPRVFKDAKPITSDAFAGGAQRWYQNGKVLVAEYWRKVTKRRELLAIKAADGSIQPVFADEITAGNPVVLKRRMVDAVSVEMHLTNGVEILSKQTDWRGKYIPFVPCYGKVLFVDDGGEAKREILSLVRLARDPYKLYCFARSTQGELAARTPKTSVVGYAGQFRGHEQEWQDAYREPKAYVEVEATTEATGNNVLPLPQPNIYDPPIERLEVLCEAARRAIQAAMGTSPLPTSAQRRNEKSGKALQQIEEAGQKGAFHFVDHYEASLRRTGEILNDLIPHYYDTARDVATRKPDDTLEVLRINDPQAKNPGMDGPGELPMTVGEFDVTIGTGPAFDSQREEASAFADVLMASPMAPQIADLAIKLKNLGPIGEELADRLTPPPFRKPKDGKVDAVVLQQQVGQATEAIDALTKELQAALQKIETEQIKAQKDILIAEMDNATRIRIAEINAQAKRLEASVKAVTSAAELEAKALNQDFQASERESQQAYEAEQGERERENEREAEGLEGSADA